MGKGYYSQPKKHEFTSFEIQIALGLMCRGVHLLGPEHNKKGEVIEYEAKHKREVYTTFATRMNEILHGEDYAQDISKKDITALIDRLTAEHKNLFGSHGYLDRNGYRRLTRSINRAFLSNRKQNYDGSKQEWEMGRKKKVENELRREQGLPTIEEEEAHTRAREEVIKARKEREAAENEEQLRIFRAEREKEKQKEMQNARPASASILKGWLPSIERSGVQATNTLSTAAGNGNNETISASVLHSLLPSIETTNTPQSAPSEMPREDVRRDEYGRPLSKPRVRANNSRFFDTSRPSH
ncbi:hypothetical protein HYFRA_00000306 [Hymenoscyphus fraxineus]|uniref:Uncharacterized protein n=1 Tax=Hymenoscyphus fraxineus TaxID=746836 RepID=A0A9N9L4F5_9HELO|nr:hypothetical protein HYFRA_00000306 [Hymenoscyphus fraxineus]